MSKERKTNYTKINQNMIRSNTRLELRDYMKKYKCHTILEK